MTNKSSFWITIFIVSWSLYCLYPFTFSEPGISADGVTYVHIAKNIVLDGSPGWQATWAAPFFSVLIAAVYAIVENFAVAGMLVSKIMTVLLPLAVYLLGRELFSAKIGILAAVLTAFHPHFTFISGSVEPEATYTTLLVFSLWAIWKAFKSSGQWSGVSDQLTQNSKLKTQNLLWAVIAGILASLAYQTRSEGLLIFILSFACMILIFIKELPSKRDIRKVLIFLVLLTSFILASLPYVLFLKDTYGKIVLSPKSTYVQIWMKWRIYHDNDLGEQGNPDLWGLSKNGKLMWQEPKGIGDLVQYLMSQPEKSMRVYLENFSRQIPGRIPNNSGQWLYPQVYPWYFVIPALFWIVVSFAGREKRKETMFLLSPFAILLVLPVFSGGWWKYLLPYAPFLIILAVAGFSHIGERIRWRHLLPAAAIVIVIYSLWTVKASPLVKHGDKGVIARGSMLEEQKKAGAWAQKRFPGTHNYMVQWSKLAYYLNGRWTAMPVTDYNGMVWYAKKNKVDYLVFETMGRGESEELLKIMGNTADLEVADVYESTTSGYSVVFLRLKK